MYLETLVTKTTDNKNTFLFIKMIYLFVNFKANYLL